MEDTSAYKDRKGTKRVCMALLAHVDSGKTTFSEQLLCHMGVIRTPGRVDDGTTVMDGDEVEKARGITIYADQSQFEYEGAEYNLLDTPGHVDFSPETERAIMVLDYGVQLIDGSSPVAAHAVTLFRLLERYQVPAFFFINKMDLETADEEKIRQEIREKLTEDAVFLDKRDAEILTGKSTGEPSEALMEFAAERDDSLMEEYLEGKPIDGARLTRSLTKLIRQRRAFVCMKGSAAKDQGIEEFFQVFHCLTETACQAEGKALGLVYKMRRDEKGRRLAFLKVLSGTLRVKDEVFCLEKKEGTSLWEAKKEAGKINEIRVYSGQKSRTAEWIPAGSLCAVAGIEDVVCGNVIGPEEGSAAEAGEPENTVRDSGLKRAEQYRECLMVPVFQAEAVSEKTDSHTLLKLFRVLEEENPQLAAECREDGRILISVMGKIQLEVLKQVLEDRFGVEVSFSRPEVLYRETIGKPVMGYGHYEPLRHYAEVHFRLEPGARGSGITFESQCHVDTLAMNYQNLIKTHVFERVYRGILTGSPLTDVHIVLTAGKSHLKHTEGGDFREAVRRAIRQGLEKAENILLEPWFSIEVAVEQEYAGRVMADIQKRHGTLEPPEQSGQTVYIRGRGPAAEFMDYGIELASATRGSGSISMIYSGYAPCHNPEEVIQKRAYDKGADKENPSSSVFCSHGAGFVVNWDKVEEYIHLPLESLEN